MALILARNEHYSLSGHSSDFGHELRVTVVDGVIWSDILLSVTVPVPKDDTLLLELHSNKILARIGSEQHEFQLSCEPNLPYRFHIVGLNKSGVIAYEYADEIVFLGDSILAMARENLHGASISLSTYLECQRFSTMLRLDMFDVNLTQNNVYVSGCSTGSECYVLRKLGAKSVTGFDIDRAAIQVARARFGNIQGIHFVEDRQVTFSERYDLIISRHVLEHISVNYDERAEYIRYLASLCQPSGDIYIEVPNQLTGIEPHTNIPFFHLLEPSIQRNIINAAEEGCYGEMLSEEQLRRMKELLVHKNVASSELHQMIPKPFYVKHFQYLSSSRRATTNTWAPTIQILLSNREKSPLQASQAPAPPGMDQRPAGDRRPLPCASAVGVLLIAAPGIDSIQWILPEALAMRALGVKLQIAAETKLEERLADAFPYLIHDERLFFFYSSIEMLVKQAAFFDVAVATNSMSAQIVARLISAYPGLLATYYVQDYEPMFYKKGSLKYREAAESYTLIPRALFVAKTRSLCDTLQTKHGINVEKIAHSVDGIIYFPSIAARPTERPVRLTATVRPASACHAARRTLCTLQQIRHEFGNKVQIELFGCTQAELQAHPDLSGAQFPIHGSPTRDEAARRLRHTDIFVDLCDCPASGPTALEAMACGCAVVLPIRSAAAEYAVNTVNSLLVDSGSDTACLTAIRDLVCQSTVRNRLSEAAAQTAPQYSVRAAALSLIRLFTQRLGARPRQHKPPGIEYTKLVPAVRRLVLEAVPPSAVVAVVSKGDPQLLNLDSRTAWHFPRRNDGVYLGHHPEDSSAAKNHLASLIEQGADYLVFPETAFWWFDHYWEFREHLEFEHKRVCTDDNAVIYRLKGSSSAKVAKELTARACRHVKSHGFLSIFPVLPPSPLSPRKASVDVIVCIHNALEDAKACLASVLSTSQSKHAKCCLIIVDDGSDAETADFLACFAKKKKAVLIRNATARGYTLAANQGLRRSRAEYAVVLNSDTITTPGWLDRLVACAESDPQLGLVGPLSNTASWQSIPKLSENGDWATNKLPEGITLPDWADLVAQRSAQSYPRLRLLNGFCLMIRRAVIKSIGYFDEQAFGRGYGEENDYCLRAGAAGWKLAVADDAYVLHQQSRSYSPQRRLQLCRVAAEALTAKHGQEAVQVAADECRNHRVLAGIRAGSAALYERHRLIRLAQTRWAGRRVLIVLPSSGGNGGCNVVIQEANAMREMGVEVTILNFVRNRESFIERHPENRVPLLCVDSPEFIPDLLRKYEAVIATDNASVEWLQFSDHSTKNKPAPVRAYYIQDFEPYFYEPGSQQFKTAWNSYDLYPDLLRLTKTNWNAAVVKEQIGVDCHIVGPSVDIDLFRPRPRINSDHSQGFVRIAAMIRPRTPWRAAKHTMETLEEVWRASSSDLEITIFGCKPGDPDLAALPQDFPHLNAGLLTRAQTASFLNQADIFIDLSKFQAMGLTAMEAMACGVAAIVPKQGGTSSFARHNENSLVVDTKSHDECVATLRRLIDDLDLRIRISQNALADMCNYFPEKAAYKILESLFER